jgi:hypothetical protein
MNLRTSGGAESSDGAVKRHLASTSCGTLAIALMILAIVCIVVTAGVGIDRLHADGTELNNAAACGGRVSTSDESQDEETNALVIEHHRAMFGY